MAGSSRGIDHPRQEYDPLEKSADGLFYVVDAENDMYEIEEFLGDNVVPICQVFRAKYSTKEKTGVKIDHLGERRRRGSQIDRIVVALKLARIDGSAEFRKMRDEVDNSFKMGMKDDIPNNVITDPHFIVGIYKSFCYKNLLCVSMPYKAGGSIRYIINKKFPDCKLPKQCVSLVIRAILYGLLLLHDRAKRVHMKLNAGNIFVGDSHDPSGDPLTIKLGYQGSTYFHNPEADDGTRIWDKSWNPGVRGTSLCVASLSDVNNFWAIRGIYEPNSSDQQNYSSESDIWNLGVIALELALGPLRTNSINNPSMKDDLRTKDEFDTFLTNLCDNEESRLPQLLDLFFPDPKSRTTANKRSITSRSIGTARKMGKGMINAGKKVKILMKKVNGKILRRKPKQVPQESSAEGPELDANVEDLLSNSLTAMVKKCLAFDPKKRPRAEVLLKDKFIEDGIGAGMSDFIDVIRNENS